MNQSEGEWGELVTIAFIEVVLELHPVKPQRVKECTPGLHKKQDTHRGKDEDDATNNKGEIQGTDTKASKSRTSCISKGEWLGMIDH